MNEKLFIQLCEIILATASVVGIFFILAASWYDLRMVHVKKQVLTALSKMTNRRQQPISVLIYTQNDLDALKSCLESVVASQYKNYKVIVADNASTDGTKKYLTRYKKLHSSLPLLTYHTRTTTDRRTILRKALRKDQSSQLVVLLNATSTITSTLLHESASRFTGTNTLEILRLRGVPADDLSISSLTTYFKSLSKNMLLKTFARSHLVLRNAENTAFVIRRSIFENTITAKKMNIDYASTIAYTQSSKKLLTPRGMWQPIASLQWLRLFYLTGTIAGVSLMLAAITYFAYTASTLQSNILLTLSWILVCLWLLATVWPDSVYKLDKKIELTFAVPFMYFVFYIQMVYVLFVSLWNLGQYVRLPSISLNKIHEAIQLELYSTHY
jgi:glycosyltransferase involved in cell wall biosynthesis